MSANQTNCREAFMWKECASWIRRPIAHNCHHNVPQSTGLLFLPCKGQIYQCLCVRVRPLCSHAQQDKEKCCLRLLKSNQWNSLFYILNSKLSQGSKHGAMVSRNCENTEPQPLLTSLKLTLTLLQHHFKSAHHTLIWRHRKQRITWSCCLKPGPKRKMMSDSVSNISHCRKRSLFSVNKIKAGGKK